MTFKMTALYAWGANSHGQLGLGFVSEQVNYVKIFFPTPTVVQNHEQN